MDANPDSFKQKPMNMTKFYLEYFVHVKRIF
jgi:hypothetical protein